MDEREVPLTRSSVTVVILIATDLWDYTDSRKFHNS